ncbi:hypothetical protein CLIB1423_02S11188 [[Candida] railenensis]|uniref:Uncharacterized protein n=1 Tax=[Candida] railenensis TaxID=45579 RepID=A0A9P0QLX2_9ASCO|nr:hypothetical protein CLIB1423_02S11188 [[Candida] railenensis]
MSDAFDNYCITCDQLCSQNSIYCSDSCKHIDEAQASSVSTTSSHLPGLVSPLLTPSEYQHYSDYNTTASSQYLTESPLMLSKQSSIDLEYHSFDLNKPSDSTIVPSTSNNYRKWLTACL